SILADGNVFDKDVSSIRVELATNHVDRCSFAGTVGTKKSKDFAVTYAESDIVDGLVLTETLANMLDLETILDCLGTLQFLTNYLFDCPLLFNVFLLALSCP